MTTIPALLRRYGLRPRKRFSQSFLMDEDVMARIVGAAELTAADTVVEIGAGLGVMTELIAAVAGRVLAVEVDPALAAVLRERFSGRENVEVRQEDILAFDFAAAAGKGKLKVVGNIPYAISSPILFAALDARRAITTAVMMFQAEVAARLAAPPGGKTYGIPSVITAMYAELAPVLSVPADRFYPRPKVDSAVLKIAMRAEPLVALRDPDLFRRLVRIAFSQRRKTIANNLRGGQLAGFADEAVAAALGAAGIDGRRRAETLSAAEFGVLSNELSARGGAESA